VPWLEPFQHGMPSAALSSMCSVPIMLSTLSFSITIPSTRYIVRMQPTTCLMRRGIAVRQDLTDEWKDLGAGTSVEFAILTNEIMQGAFGLKVDEYKQVKDLERENLRDHMTDIELILTMLAEEDKPARMAFTILTMRGSTRKGLSRRPCRTWRSRTTGSSSTRRR
jgi:hypothetical protein